jgi:hypothetical protein
MQYSFISFEEMSATARNLVLYPNGKTQVEDVRGQRAEEGERANNKGWENYDMTSSII